MDLLQTNGNQIPRLAMCNFIEDLDELHSFAADYNFDGLDWSFHLDQLPETPVQQSNWVQRLQTLSDLEIRYHCPFDKVDLGHRDPDLAGEAVSVFKKVIRLVSRAQGHYLTLHLGLGHDTTHPFSWDITVANLTHLARFAADRGVRLCLENLAWGWTSKPNLFEKLIRRSGVGMTFDIGHAHACEAVRSQHYEVQDFISPHADRVYNAHIYHTEIPGVGHVPPQQVSDIDSRLELLLKVGCRFWTLEIREKEGLLKTKKIIDSYLEKRQLSRHH